MDFDKIIAKLSVDREKVAKEEAEHYATLSDEEKVEWDARKKKEKEESDAEMEEWRRERSVRDLVSKCKPQYNGHFKEGVSMEGHNPLKDFYCSEVSAEAVNRILDEEDDTFIPLRGGTLNCSECGDRIKWETNGKETRVIGECKFPTGCPDFVGEINVPSGKLVFGNDYRGLFPVDPAGDICTKMGSIQHTAGYLSNGMAHGFCGNTCPGVYRTDDGSIKIANGVCDFDEWAFEDGGEREEWADTNTKRLYRLYGMLRKGKKAKGAFYNKHPFVVALKVKYDTAEYNVKYYNDKTHLPGKLELYRSAEMFLGVYSETLKRTQEKAKKQTLKRIQGLIDKERKSVKVREGEYLKERPELQKEWEALQIGERVGGVCTDLWWYSAADRDEMLRRISHYGKCEATDDNLGSDDVVEVKPGVYEFTHFADSREEENRTGRATYAQFKWLRDPDPIYDYLSDLTSLRLTAGQCVSSMLDGEYGDYHYNCRTKPADLKPDGKYTHHRDGDIPSDLSGYELTSTVHFVTGRIFDGRYDSWHENGHNAPEGTPADQRDMEIPEFDSTLVGRYDITYNELMTHFGATPENSGVLRGSSNPWNDSFAALAYNFLQNMIRYGLVPFRLGMAVDTEKQYLKMAKEQIADAKRAYLYLCEAHPNQMPDYCAGLEEELKLEGIKKQTMNTRGWVLIRNNSGMFKALSNRAIEKFGKGDQLAKSMERVTKRWGLPYAKRSVNKFLKDDKYKVFTKELTDLKTLLDSAKSDPKWKMTPNMRTYKYYRTLLDQSREPAHLKFRQDGTIPKRAWLRLGVQG